MPLLNLEDVPPATSVEDAVARFDDRLRAALLRNAGIALKDASGQFLGEDRCDWTSAVVAHLAFEDYFPPDRQVNGKTGAQLRDEAIESLGQLQRRSDWLMGTTIVERDEGFILGTLEDLGDLFVNFLRKGEYDVNMNTLVTILYKYGKHGESHGGHNKLPADVYQRVLSLIDLTTPGVERLELTLNPVPTCVLVAIVASPAVALVCLALVEAMDPVRIPETENHLNLIYVSRYLANQLMLEETGDPKYDNSRNGYRELMLKRLAGFIRSDFIEYNAHPYQDYTMQALLSLYSYADDPKVKRAAQMVLDYVSAKVAVSSNDARRSTPFRRLNEAKYFCNELIRGCGPGGGSGYDPQTAFYMMLAGVTDMADAGGATDQDAGAAFGLYAIEFQLAGLSDYRIPPLIHDLFVSRGHRNFYQFFHYCNTDCNDELYAGSPSFLIAAGGHPTAYAYTTDIPFPADLAVAAIKAGSIGTALPNCTIGGRCGGGSDTGVSVPTVFIPGGKPASPTHEDKHSRDQMLRFYVPGGTNMCVAPNFACGLNPAGLDDVNYPPGPEDERRDSGWSFINKGAPKGEPGYYVAFYRQEDFGFLEAYDTFPGTLTFAEFKTRVQDNNPGPFSRDGKNTYKRVNGTTIEFNPGSGKIENPIYDPNRTSGTILNADGNGLVQINNPALGERLTLDGRDPEFPVRTFDAPLITVPGPLRFTDTCVGQKSFTSANICNTGFGDEPFSTLFVYNILSKDPVFEVTEPTWGYPVAVGPAFCFPFEAQFTPASASQVTSSVQISSNDPGKPFLDLQTTGKGIQQFASTSGALDFGQACVGEEKTRSVKICDTGSCNLKVTGASLTGGQCSGLEIVNPPPYPLTVSPDFCFDFNVKFKPTGPVAIDCKLEVTTDDPDPARRTLQFPINAGVGTPNLVIDPPTLTGNYAFPPAVIDPTGTLSCHSEATAVVLNNGACAATITSIGATTPFNVTAPTQFPQTLPPGHSLKVTGRFTPTADASGPSTPGSIDGTLAVTATYGTATLAKAAPVCGEPVSQSGARVLVVNSANTPVPLVDSLTLTSKGIQTPSPIQIRLSKVTPATTSVCGNTVQFHLNTESLPPSQTTGSTPKSSYTVSVRVGNKQATQSFTVGQCELKPIILKVQ